MVTLRPLPPASALALLVSLAACARPAADRGSSRADSGTAAPPAAATAHPGTAPAAAPAAPAAPATDSAGARAPHDGTATLTSAGAVTPAAPDPVGDAPAVRALYVNRFAAQSTKRMRELIAIADSTEINGLVIDMKDEFGLDFQPTNPDLAKYMGSGNGLVKNPKALVDSLHAHHLVAIARMVVFKDPVAAKGNPSWTIRTPSGDLWRDHKGFTWVNPYDHRLWDYNIGLAEELARLGFDEIQFDYIRFPEPFRSLPTQVFPGAVPGQTKPQALADFLKTARERVHRVGNVRSVRVTADIFGLVTTVSGALEVGQAWEPISPNVDVVLPMTYPSHYPPGSFGIARPNADPYRTIDIAVSRARERDEKLGIPASREHVRPWLQAFTLGKPEYGPDQLRQQKQAVYDAGYDGWVMWNPGSKYELFVPGLERGALVSHRKTQPTPAPKITSE